MDVKKVEKLAQRQKALSVTVSYKGEPLGSLKEVLRRIQEHKLEKDLAMKLSALERLCFDFNHLSSFDLEALNLPSSVPSTGMVTNVEMFRNNEFEQPYFRITFHDDSSSEGNSQIGFLQVVYEPFSKSLYIYTCANLRIGAGEGLSLELIPRAYLTAAQILRTLSIPVEYAYAYYMLWGGRGLCEPVYQ